MTSGQGVYRPRSYVDTGAYERAPDVDDFLLSRKVQCYQFVVAYSPTDTVSNTREHKDVFWADLESAVSRVPSSDYLFVLIDANARTGAQMGEEEDC